MKNNVINLSDHRNNASIAISDQDGNPWFLAENVCNELGIDMSQLMGVVEPDQTAMVNGMSIISETGFYSAIYYSSTPGALKWQDYLTNEALPHYLSTGELPVPDKKMYDKLTKAPAGMLSA